MVEQYLRWTLRGERIRDPPETPTTESDHQLPPIGEQFPNTTLNNHIPAQPREVPREGGKPDRGTPPARQDNPGDSIDPSPELQAARQWIRRKQLDEELRQLLGIQIRYALGDAQGI